MTRTRLFLLLAASTALISACASSGGAAPEAEPVDAVGIPAPPPPPPAPPPMPLAGAPMVSGMMSQSYKMAPAARMELAVRPAPMPGPAAGDVDRENYAHTKPNPVKLVADEPVSTFSVDVDTAAYANVRRFLQNGSMPPQDAVRIEELVNYFDYGYAPPAAREVPFSTHVEVTPAPWAEGRQLMLVALQGYDFDRNARPPINLTLLVDVSGSMGDENKLPLARKALRMLVDEMRPEDRISMVVYAGAAGAVLEPTSGSEKGKILAALDALNAGGSTAGGEGLRLAYTLAEQNFDKKAVNRVMLLTDGDFNVGINNPDQLEDFVERKRETGVYLSILGFGEGNYNDALMQRLVQAGNGAAAYIDTLNEARKVLVDDLSGSLFTIANDVKIQVEFNPARVAEYRLIGYETRMLNREDFSNDRVDAGDIGAGHSVTAIYEITPVGSSARLIEPGRYASTPPARDSRSGELAFLRLRYKIPGSDTSRLIERPIISGDVRKSLAEARESTRFAVSVAGYGGLLRGDAYLAKSYSFDDVIALAQGSKGEDPFGYRSEFIQLARQAKTAAAQAALERPGAGETPPN